MNCAISSNSTRERNRPSFCVAWQFAVIYREASASISSVVWLPPTFSPKEWICLHPFLLTLPRGAASWRVVMFGWLRGQPSRLAAPFGYTLDVIGRRLATAVCFQRWPDTDPSSRQLLSNMAFRTTAPALGERWRASISLSADRTAAPIPWRCPLNSHLLCLLFIGPLGLMLLSQQLDRNGRGQAVNNPLQDRRRG